MPDRATPGQKFFQTPFAKAAVQNRVLNVTEIYSRAELLGQRQGLPYTFNTGVDVQVRNNSGSDWLRGGVATVYDMALDELDPLNFWFEADDVDVTGDTEHPGRAYGVLLGALPAGEFGSMRISGVCPARVNINSNTHFRARAKTGQNYFESCVDSQGAAIFWQPGGTGMQMCAVQLGIFPKLRIGITAEDIFKGDNGDVWSYLPNEYGPEVATGFKNRVRNIFRDVLEGTWVAYLATDGVFYLIAAACSPEELS